MAVTGANLEQLKLTGQGMLSRADQIDAIIQWIDSQLPQTEWTGGYAQQYFNNWQAQYKPGLKSTSAGMRDQGNYLITSAQNLGQASGTTV